MHKLVVFDFMMAAFLLASFFASLISIALGWGCPGPWMTFGDGDPHFVINFTHPSFDRPVCFDLNGKPGESYTLFSVKDAFRLRANLVRAVHEENGKVGTYFGSFSFYANPSDVRIDVDSVHVNVSQGALRKSVPWPHTKPYPKKIYPEEFENAPMTIIKNVTITHIMHDYLRIIINGSDMHIDRHNRKYCEGKHTCKRIPFVGVYLQPTPKVEYGGLLGEHINETVIFRNASFNPLRQLGAFGDINTNSLEDATNHAILHNGQILKVTDHKVMDQMKNRPQSCWKIIENDKFMHHSLDFYKKL